MRENGKAPTWFYERMAEADSAPLSERELAAFISPVDGNDSNSVRLVAEVMRLRAQVELLRHATPASRGRRKVKET